MHDIKAIRENPAAFDAAWARKGLAPQTPRILELDVAVRAAKTQRQEAEAGRNAASKAIGAAKAKKDDTEAGGRGMPHHPRSAAQYAGHRSARWRG